MRCNEQLDPHLAFISLRRLIKQGIRIQQAERIFKKTHTDPAGRQLAKEYPPTTRNKGIKKAS